MKTIDNLDSWQDILGALVDMGAGACLIENEEQAKYAYESIQNATCRREIEQGDDFETSMRRLDLSEANGPAHIYSWVQGSEFLICLPDDWQMN